MLRRRLALLVASVAIPAFAASEFFYEPPQGFVPNKETAIAIAVAIWTPIYGREQIESEKPFNAALRGDTWYVTGTLPDGYVGGVAEAAIRKRDGRISQVTHGQ